VEQLGDRVRAEGCLRQKSDGRAPNDEFRERILRVGRDQDDPRPVRIRGESSSQLEAVFLAQLHIDEHHVGLQRPKETQRLRPRGGPPHDLQPLRAQKPRRRIEKLLVVINDQAPQAHPRSVAEKGRRHNEASPTSSAGGYGCRSYEARAVRRIEMAWATAARVASVWLSGLSIMKSCVMPS
jgi:hypothetical protein